MFGRFMGGMGGFRGVRLAMRAARRASRQRIGDTKHLNTVDYKDRVGQSAGDLYNLIQTGGETTLKELRGKTKNHGMLFWAAIGWLSREDKIDLSASESGVRVKAK